MSGNNFIWVLKGEPKAIEIIDRNGEKRLPDMKKIEKNKRLKPGMIAGNRFGFGVGVYLYGGKPLGKKAELEAKGNTYTTNDQILRAIGYEKQMLDENGNEIK